MRRGCRAGKEPAPAVAATPTAPYSIRAASRRPEDDMPIERALAFIAENRTGMVILVVVMLITLLVRRR